MTDKSMDPLSGEPVEVDGVYSNDWGREQLLKRGDIFPADPQLGTTSWKLVSYATDSEQLTGDTVDPRYRNERYEQNNNDNKPRMHVDRGDK